MALRIEKAFGPDMDHLLRMQVAYDTTARRCGSGRGRSRFGVTSQLEGRAVKYPQPIPPEPTMPTRTLRRGVVLYDLSRVGFGGLRLAVVLLLASAALRALSLAWIGAGTLIGSIALWLICLPTSAECDRLRAQGLVPPRTR